MAEKPQKRALTPKDVQEMYGLTVGHQANMRCKRRGPKFFKVGGSVFLRPEDVDAWFFANPVLTIDSREI